MLKTTDIPLITDSNVLLTSKADETALSQPLGNFTFPTGVPRKDLLLQELAEKGIFRFDSLGTLACSGVLPMGWFGACSG